MKTTTAAMMLMSIAASAEVPPLPDVTSFTPRAARHASDARTAEERRADRKTARKQRLRLRARRGRWA